MKNIILLLNAFIISAVNIQAETITDIDGNIYHTVIIGTQEWTQENLKVTHYRNGDPIPNITDSAQWYALATGAYCSYENDQGIAAVYGLLYNWYAVNDPRNLAPVGWHVPTYSDYDSLQVYLGYDLVAGGKLKEAGTLHWMSPNTGASNESDFTALPGGQRADSIYSGTFTELTRQGYWWSSSEMDNTYPWGINISYDSEGMTNWAASTKRSGFSIRLIRDFTVVNNSKNINEGFHIYPNPAHDRLFINGPNYTNINGFMEIYDLLGNLILQREFNNSPAMVDISALFPGMYIIQFSLNDRTVRDKFLKE